MIKWHRLFGLGLTDYFTDSRYRVEMEKDLSLKQQFLDVLIIEQEGDGALFELPDGLENLARHNLVSYKSHWQPLNAWTLDELNGHFVNYRKHVSGSLKSLAPAKDFRLYIVSTRMPRKLQAETQTLMIKPGVFEIKWGGQWIRVIIPSQMPQIKRNAFWHLYSGNAEGVEYGARHYKWQQKNLSTIRNELVNFYQMKGIAMSYTVEDYLEEVRKKALASLTPEERLQGLSPKEFVKRLSVEERLKGLPAQERLKGLPAQERLKGLPAQERLKGLPAQERLKGLPAEERLKGLSKRQIEAYLKQLSAKHRGRKREA